MSHSPWWLVQLSGCWQNWIFSMRSSNYGYTYHFSRSCRGNNRKVWIINEQVMFASPISVADVFFKCFFLYVHVSHGVHLQQLHKSYTNTHLTWMFQCNLQNGLGSDKHAIIIRLSPTLQFLSAQCSVLFSFNLDHYCGSTAHLLLSAHF